MLWLSLLGEHEQVKPYRDIISIGSCSNSNVMAAQVRHNPLIRTNGPPQRTQIFSFLPSNGMPHSSCLD